MPRRKARPEADLVRLPRAGNFDQAIRKYLERNPPEYSEKRMTFPLPMDRADLDGLVSLARIELSKVPIIDQEGKRHGELFRNAGDETCLANPLHPYFSKVKHSEALLDDLAARLVTFYITDADKIRSNQETIRKRRDNLVGYLETIFAQGVPSKDLDKAVSAINRCFGKLLVHQRIETYKTPRASLTQTLFDCIRKPSGQVPRPLVSTSQDKHYDENPPDKKVLDRLLDKTPRITQEATFYVIGLIYRHQGIEEGTPQQIADRIKKEYRSKAK